MKLIIVTELLFNQERKTMNEEKNETRWDRLLAVRTTGRDDTNADQYRYPYELRLIQFWNVLANSGLIRKETHCSTTAAEKEELIFLCHIKPDVSLSVSNITSEFMKRL